MSSGSLLRPVPAHPVNTASGLCRALSSPLMIFPTAASSASRSPFLDSQPLTPFLTITFSSLFSNFKFPVSSLHLWARLGQGERRYGSGVGRHGMWIKRRMKLKAGEKDT